VCGMKCSQFVCGFERSELLVWPLNNLSLILGNDVFVYV
jgi:hypothetical protein